ncbi:bifunctional (p)ppGpp synthetase/guanosine-3',5'-bis(diphosphate) 3'-pyrophosphohydrolase [Corticibacter populi]|uniref:Bifunctional (P)ppGpp synthetase/guanosine-3',5'-bis(Diphosphate) 3'-pyrophosphohydrolase n=1 Tax=Corticibacter populi TaxID=1550736 RepID=A0A3M6QUE5_9BURK|nr:HD domain-containing protein [Corticibacter populi]RMX06655.1 bifunctional (p)ppGpp synthetase/guanosine-3',5'-bis(diphosphate) 3'-pyrophosphohydrolase [Corticibacter populi]RZS31771.1 HD domain-containing protein [Corticibacter populi]
MNGGNPDPLERAIVMAVQAHAGQRDDDGSPYILHPLRVMAGLQKPATPEQRMAAVLHDTLEQTALTRADLLAAGIPAEVVEAVEILTRPETESRLSATRRAAQNPIARAVKRADILDNMDLSRIPAAQPEDHARMQEYRAALALLEAL